MSIKPINPANREAKPSAERKRIPLSIPVRKLEVPEIPGYHLHWFSSNGQRIKQAQNGGYEFVLPEEVEMNPIGLGASTAASSNASLGSHVSVISGQNERGDTEELILMKIKQEWYEEDQKLLEQRNDSVAAALTGGVAGQNEAQDRGEQGFRYVGSRTKLPDLFTKGAFAKKNRAGAS